MSTLYHGFDAAAVAATPPADLVALFDLPRDAEVIVHAAAMTPWKGQDILVDAFRSVAAARPKAHLVLVGGSQGSGRQDRFEAAVREKVAAAGLGARVTFTGWRDDWCAIVAAAEVFVHAPTGADPLPLVVLHAAALGRAIVASPVGGIPEILGDPPAGLWAPPGEATALAAAIESLLADPGRGRALGAAARERAATFSVERMTATLAGLYDRLLHERR
jgi:glycosyltransferase involved in cell wall biosynthesis